MSTEKHIQEATLDKDTGSKIKFYLKDGSVVNNKLADGAVTSVKMNKSVWDRVQDIIDEGIVDLKHQIDSYSKHGVFIRNEFGQDPYVGISQKALTGAINNILNKIGEIIGIDASGITMTVSPTFFTSADGAEITIIADSSQSIGNFEHISFYLNNELLAEYEDISSIELTATITQRTEIKCVAQIMGETYTNTQVVDRPVSFYMGGGDEPANIIDEDHSKDIQEGMEGLYEISLAEGDHLMIVMDTSYSSQFDRADMNGFEIPFVVTTLEHEGVTYKVYKTANTYKEGTYNIYINR